MYRKLMSDSALKLGTVLMIITVIASAMTVLVVFHAETDNSSAEVTESGWCGENTYYCIYSDGTLLIDGSGAMYDYRGFTHAPWYEHRDEITTIVIGNQILQLGQWAFVGLKHVTELSIPVTLNSVVSDTYPAFAGCYRIEKIEFTFGNNGCCPDYSAYEGNNNWYQLTPWYQSRDSLKEIRFDDGITHIGADAFRELKITSLELLDSVATLGCHCFYNCTELTELTIPIALNSVVSDLYPAFAGCCRIEKIDFTPGSNGCCPDYATSKGNNYWYQNTPWYQSRDSLKEIRFFDGVKSISADTFRELSIITLVLPDSIMRLGCHCFYNCHQLSDLTIPISLNAVWYDDYAAFDRVTGLQKVNFTVGSGYGFDYAAYVGYNAWYQKTPWYQSKYAVELSFAEGIKRIGSDAFHDLLLDSVEIPNTVESLGNHAFCNCWALKSLTIPITLNSVGSEQYPAFEDVYYLDTLRLTPGTTGVGYNYVGSSPFWNYKYSWVISVTLDQGITYVGTNTFTELRFYKDGQPLETTAANLSGYVFHNVGQNRMELVGEAPHLASNANVAGSNVEIHHGYCIVPSSTRGLELTVKFDVGRDSFGDPSLCPNRISDRCQVK